MHITIDHFTRYQYSQPASGIIQLLRLTPHGDDNQQILRWRIDVDADGRLIPFTDSHGNFAHSFYADHPVTSLTIHVSGELITTVPELYSQPVNLKRAHGSAPGLASNVTEPCLPLKTMLLSLEP